MSFEVKDAAIKQARALVKQVFRFLKALAESNIPIIRSTSSYEWRLRLEELPKHPAISIGEVQLTGAAQNGIPSPEDAEPLIRVRRPLLTIPPAPPPILQDWLKTGWEDPISAVEILASRMVKREGETVEERFDAERGRVEMLREWKPSWERWAEAEKPARAAMKVFERMYQLHGRIELESENLELVLGDGHLRWRGPVGVIDHPILLQRVDLQFDADVPEFRIVDTDRAPELYAAVLQGGEGISPEQLAKLRDELEKGGYHPLASDGTSAYLRRLVQVLGPHGSFQSEQSEAQRIGPDPLIIRDPVLFLRKRSSGFPAAFDKVLEELETDGPLPPSLVQLVGIESPPPPDPPPDLSSPWAEPTDILLSKPANAEQIGIARALDRHKAVLVQGPPGTGKSHTIANLIGHLVAQGKRVLVTSHTTKALRVLRDHVVKELQPLCVSVLENDLEGRILMEQAVKGILTRLTLANSPILGKEVEALSNRRLTLIKEINRLTDELGNARESEYRSIVVGAESLAPADAARWVRSNRDGNDWIPGPVESLAPLPVTGAEVGELYETNAALSLAEEDEIGSGLPSMDSLLTPSDLAADVAASQATEPSDLVTFWSRSAGEAEIETLAELLDLLERTAYEVQNMAAWQRTIVSAGHSGGTDRDLWSALGAKTEEEFQQWDRCKNDLLEHNPELAAGIAPEDQNRVASEIAAHIEIKGDLKVWSLLFHGEWKRLIRGWRVNGRQPVTLAEFVAIRKQLELDNSRRRLAQRWTRQAVPAGFPALESMGDPPEPALREYVSQFQQLLDWWPSRWEQISTSLRQSGFRWREFREREVANSRPLLPFQRDVEMVAGPLQSAVRHHLSVACRARSLRRLASIGVMLAGKPTPVCTRIRVAARLGDVPGYEAAFKEMSSLHERLPVFARRSDLIGRLAAVSLQWASAIRKRQGLHGEAKPPSDPAIAWRWIQLNQEIDRRAGLDVRSLERSLYQRRDELRETTAALIDRMAWLAQLQRTDLRARMALQGWADTQKRIGKGTGKRVPWLQAKARELLAQARHAVPVWIMPMARVAESFGSTQGRFDVVVVDEASQSDVLGLLAWYLGDRVVIVGDHEQVSPLAVGEEMTAVQALIDQHLSGVPNSHLYDGRLSIYHLARHCFGGSIALREHFRCVPDIIEFSNNLSYNGEIRPLRNPGSAPQPHLVDCCVDGRLTPTRTGTENLVEARMVAAIVKALTELPTMTGKTIGAITLLGDEQAHQIQSLCSRLVGPGELERRRFVAGNSAQYQGDERDVMLLSMVDVPTGAPLSLKTTDAFKQRYNVASSRAKDQLWLVRSIEADRDLKSGDLRRRLIEHFRDPMRHQRAYQEAERRAESPFEIAVAKRLIAAGYRVRSQQWVGRYRIDMVVSDNVSEVAVECDGERFHGFDQIQADMARQAVLERAGWRFIRIRSTRFYRDPEEAMEEVFEELRRLEIEPVGEVPEEQSPARRGAEFRERVLARAWEIMRSQGWIESAVSLGPGVSPGAAPQDRADASPDQPSFF